MLSESATEFIVYRSTISSVGIYFNPVFVKTIEFYSIAGILEDM